MSAGVSLRADGRVKPLEDIRIVAVEQFGAGPFGTLQLAELRAEVIKVEDPAAGGDERPSYRRAPRRNEDADHVLGTVLGYDSARIEQLSGAVAFGR